MYRIDLLIQGFPGKSACHGGLGWSTIALLRSEQRTVLIDVGSFGMRKPLQRQLLAHGVAPDQVTDVVLTHVHYDHSVNFVLFDKATVWVGSEEIDWASAQPPGFDPLPELYVDALASEARVQRIRAGEEFLPGLVAQAAPGHTPGSLIFHLTANEAPVIFTGDAAKNRAELLSGEADSSEDPAASRASIEAIWTLWRARPGTVLVPGHDLSMVLDADGQPTYLGKRKAAIDAWFSQTLEDVSTFDLTGEA